MLSIQELIVLQNHSLENAQAAIRAFIEEHNIPEGLMPTNQQLTSAGQHRLRTSIMRLGGMKKFAASMHLQFSTSQAPTLTLAAQGLQLYAQQHLADPGRAPSFAALFRAGRHDLLAGYKKYGQSKVVEAAGMTPGTLGRPTGSHSGQSPIACDVSTEL